MRGFVRRMEALDLGPRDAGRTARHGARLVAPAVLALLLLAGFDGLDGAGPLVGLPPGFGTAIFGIIVALFLLIFGMGAIGLLLLAVSGALALFWGSWALWHGPRAGPLSDSDLSRSGQGRADA